MKLKATLASIAVGVMLAGPVHAHRLEGLVQSSLVEVSPSQVGVEVTLVPGIDIAPRLKFLLDTNGDGHFSKVESDAWAALFMTHQSVTADGQSLPLVFKNVRASPLAEMTSGHAEIVVSFTVDLGQLARGPRVITHANRYEPFPCFFQCNGLVPKSPSVQIKSHQRDERQQELTLATEFSVGAKPATPIVSSTSMNRRSLSVVAIFWLLGLSAAGVIIATIAGCRWRSPKAPL